MMKAVYKAITHTYKTVGDLKIELDVYTPSTAAPASGYPVFFAIHGGAFIFESKKGIPTSQQLNEAINRGWAVVSINYRLWPGVFLQDILEDVQDAYQFVRTELIKTTPINPAAITVFGQSAGGGLAVLSGYKLSPRPQAIIGFYPGCTNWTDPFAYNPDTPFDPSLVNAAKKLSVPVVAEHNPSESSDARLSLADAAQASSKMGWLAVTHDPNLPPEEIMARLKGFSAVYHVDEDYPPTFLGHGLADEVVPSSQSVELADVLKQKGIPYVLDLVPGADHGFDSEESNWEKHVLPAFDFVQKYMQSSDNKKMEK